MTSQRGAALALTIALTLTAGACGTDPDPPRPTPARPSTSSPSPDAASTPTPGGSGTPSTVPAPEDFATEVQQSDSWPELGPRAGVGVAVRVGRQEGYDRVVYEFDGSALPTYEVRYVDTPVSEGSGEPVEIAGDAYLSVRASTLDIPPETGTEPPQVPDSRLAGTVVAQAPAMWGGFEGYGQAFIGITGEPRPFRVSVLGEPSRLVVDLWR